METKQCSWCYKQKPIQMFYKRNNRKSGRTSRCSDCLNRISAEKHNPKLVRAYDLKRAYGITQEDYVNILIKQNYRCAICKRHESEVTKGHKKFLCIDHCHKTKNVRGLLCDGCNRGLGLLKDNIEYLKNAIEYLSQ